MAASQNEFCSYKLSIHKKTNIMQIMTKTIKTFIYLIFSYREIVKLDHFDAAVAESTVCSSPKNTCQAEFRREPILTRKISSFVEHGALLKIIVNLKRSLLFGRSFMEIPK